MLSTVAENVSPVLCVIITSVWPDAERRLLLKASAIVGSKIPMPKIIITPMMMASVVRKVRSLRPRMYLVANAT